MNSTIVNCLRTFACLTLVAFLTSTADAGIVVDVVSSENNVYETDGGDSTRPFFFNAQSADPGGGTDFREFGVQDFDGSAFFANTVTAINSVNFLINDSAAGFAAAGEVAFFLAGNNTGTLTDDRAMYLPAEAPNGIGNQFGALTALGTGAYVPVEDEIDNFSLTLDAAAETQLISLLNNGETIRLIVAGNDESVIATWDGLTNFAYDDIDLGGPTLVIDAEAVPEPSSFALLSLGLVAAMRRRSRG